MRKYESIILEAELMALPPETVRTRLIEFASKATRYERDYMLDNEIEEALRLRRDPLIDLSLAQYGRFIEVVKPIFHSSPPGAALRLATLANQNFSNAFLCYFPRELFDDEEDMVEWLANGEENELCALFQNPRLHDRFLSSLLSRESDFARVGDARLAYIVDLLTNNPRMSAERDSGFMDGLSDFEYNLVFDAGWMLAERVEPTRDWARALGWFYIKLALESFSIKKPLEVAKRWYVDPANVELVAEEAAEATGAFLSTYEMVRMGLARLACKFNDNLLEGLLTHEDRAFRAAAYIDYPLTQSQLDAAYERDGELAFQNAIGNSFLWRTAKGRDALRVLAWNVNRADSSGHLDAPNQFNNTAVHMEKQNPDWFKDEPDKLDYENDDDDDDDDKLVTKRELAEVALLVAHQKSVDMTVMGKRINLIFWITAFTAIYALIKLH